MDVQLLKAFLADIKRLGAVGTLSYVGALLCFVAALIVDFTTTSKGWAMIVAGVSLLTLSGVIYLKEVLAKSANRKEALNVLKEVFNRLAEQTTKGNHDQTVSITMTINNLPQKILEVLDKL